MSTLVEHRCELYYFVLFTPKTCKHHAAQREGQGNGRKAKGRDGQRRERKGRKGKATEEKGREGKAREGQGREGKGREWKGREGKGKGKGREARLEEGHGRKGKWKAGKRKCKGSFVAYVCAAVYCPLAENLSASGPQNYGLFWARFPATSGASSGVFGWIAGWRRLRFKRIGLELGLEKGSRQWTRNRVRKWGPKMVSKNGPEKWDLKAGRYSNLIQVVFLRPVFRIYFWCSFWVTFLGLIFEIFANVCCNSRNVNYICGWLRSASTSLGNANWGGRLECRWVCLVFVALKIKTIYLIDFLLVLQSSWSLITPRVEHFSRQHLGDNVLV